MKSNLIEMLELDILTSLNDLKVNFNKQKAQNKRMLMIKQRSEVKNLHSFD